MSRLAKVRKPLCLVTDEREPGIWEMSEETDFMSRLAVCQDVWGRDVFSPGQAFALRQAANAIAINKTQIIGAIGIAMGGLGTTVQEFGAHIEVFEGDRELCEHNQATPSFLGKLIKLERWTPGSPVLKAKRYHRLITYGAFAAVDQVASFVKELSEALKPGGYLYVDEIWAEDAAEGRAIAREASLLAREMCYRRKAEVIGALSATLELRSTSEANRLVKRDIRDGLVGAQMIAQKLKLIPEPLRRQRLIALSNELQRAVVLYGALDRDVVVATRYMFHKKADAQG